MTKPICCTADDPCKYDCGYYTNQPYPSAIKPGTHALPALVPLEYRGEYSGEDAGARYDGVVSEWDDSAGADMTWEIEPDPEHEEIEVYLTVPQYADLLARAKAHCECCFEKHDR